MVLVFISPVNLFTFLLAIYAFFGKTSIHILCPYFSWIVSFCSVQWFEFLYILAVNPLSDTLFTNIFFQPIGCLFVITFYRKFLAGFSPIYFCFCCLCFWCPIHSIIDKTNIKILISISSVVLRK